MLPKTPKQKLLNTLSNDELKSLVDKLNLGAEIRKRQSRGDLLRDLSRLKRVSIEQIVEILAMPALRAACQELGLDNSGKQQKLAEQILARFGRTARKPQRMEVEA